MMRLLVLLAVIAGGVAAFSIQNSDGEELGALTAGAQTVFGGALKYSRAAAGQLAGVFESGSRSEVAVASRAPVQMTVKSTKSAKSDQSAKSSRSTAAVAPQSAAKSASERARVVPAPRQVAGRAPASSPSKGSAVSAASRGLRQGSPVDVDGGVARPDPSRALERPETTPESGPRTPRVIVVAPAPVFAFEGVVASEKSEERGGMPLPRRANRPQSPRRALAHSDGQGAEGRDVEGSGYVELSAQQERRPRPPSDPNAPWNVRIDYDGLAQRAAAPATRSKARRTAARDRANRVEVSDATVGPAPRAGRRAKRAQARWSRRYGLGVRERRANRRPRGYWRYKRRHRGSRRWVRKVFRGIDQ